MGHGSVRPIEVKVSVIVDYSALSNKRVLRRFLECVGITEVFVHFFSVVAPLTDLLSDKRKFVWSTECERAFLSGKDLLCHAPILKAPDFHRPFKLHVDASSAEAGAVLPQEDNMGVDHPVCFFPKKLQSAKIIIAQLKRKLWHWC